jgi:hypothetical protein
MPSEINAARAFATVAAEALGQSKAFRQLSAVTQNAIVRDLNTIRNSLQTPPDPYALALETPEDFQQRLRGSSSRAQADNGQPATSGSDGGPPAGPRVAATEALAARTGRLSDEINFPAFVASLVHGTFDAIVDASIRQMEAFAGLVSAVAKDVDQFTAENVTPNQVRDSLADQYPAELTLDVAAKPPRLSRRPRAEGEEEDGSPAWLVDYGLAGQELTDELIEQQLIPAARRKIGEQRLQMLATMVLLGMNRVNVKDGSVSAKIRIRAAAQDKAKVGYAMSQDPGRPTWGERGSTTYDPVSTMVSTVSANVQSETELEARLFGEVQINFVSETLPLERFADSARTLLVQRNAHWQPKAVTAPATAQPAAPAAPVEK